MTLDRFFNPDHDAVYPGEHFTCDNGHQIGTVVRRCTPGRDSTNWLDCVIWDQAKPVEDGPCTCAACGAHWVLIKRYENGGKTAYVCVDGRWRPELQDDALAYLGKPPKKRPGIWGLLRT